MTEASGGTGDPAVDIGRAAGEFGLTLEPRALAGLCAFVGLFLTWNRSINLASLKSPGELVTRHLVDALALASLTDGAVGTAVDVGSGGGLPALPLAILLSSTEFDLFEPNRKKAAFLRTAIREAGMTGRVRTHTESVAQPPAPLLRDRFDLALSRATLGPADWLAMGRQLAKPGGLIAVFAAGQSDVGLPEAEASRSYGEGRRLLLFRR